MINSHMSRLKKVLSHKKKILLYFSISLILIGFIPQLVIRINRDLDDPYSVKTLALESDDGTYISAFIYTPKGLKNHGGIVVSHRYWGDKTIMQPLSIELVRRGFTVISIDLRGHGASGGQFKENELKYDIKAAVDYFELELPYITQVGLIGHSLGARISAEFSKAYPNKINATVVIGSIDFNPVGISNLLIAVGRYEPVVFNEELLDLLRYYTGLLDVSTGKLYNGDFVGGNNVMAIIGNNDHMSEILDPTIIYHAIQWFEQTFNGAPADDIVLTEWFLEYLTYIAQFGALILIFVLATNLSKNLFHKDNTKEEEIINYTIKIGNRLRSHYTIIVMGFAVIFFFAMINILSEASQINTTISLLLFNIGAALCAYLLLPFIIMSSEDNFSFKIYISIIKTKISTQSKCAWEFGIISAFILLLSIITFWNLPFWSFLLEWKNYVVFTLLTLISFPIFFIKEFYLRTIQDNLNNPKKYSSYVKIILLGIVMDNIFIGMIFSFSWVNFIYMPISMFFFTALIRFSLIQQITAGWIYRYSRGNIVAPTIFTSIIFAGLSVIIFPSYGFL